MQLNKKQQRSFLIGTILGDSSMTGKKNKSIITGHCQSQYDYLLIKKEIIEIYCPVGVTIKEKGNKGGYKKSQKFFQLYSTSHHKITAIYNLIYENKKKVISDELLSKLDEVGLAALFMDDGSKEVRKRKDGTRTIKSYKISMGNFPLEEVELFSDWLYKNFDIESRIYLDRGQYPDLKITKKENLEKFRELVDPYVVSCLKYKLYA